MGVIDFNEPKAVFKYFEEICGIPRTSGDEKAISDYLVDFAKEHGLDYYQDEAFNVIIYKNATKGCADKETIILQSHIDMVCVHDDTATRIPEEAGVELYIDGDFIKAKGTTLGADNGIGMAFMLAVLDSDSIEHPRIEAVFTTSEEVGLIGAKALDISKLSGRRMINIDTEEEGNLVIGCAGGCRSDISFVPKEEEAEGIKLSLCIKGLVGGHSGVEIHKGSANANVIMSHLLYDLNDKVGFRLVSINGGTKDNAICDLCEAVIIVDNEDVDSAIKFIEIYSKHIKKDYHVTDPDIMLICVNDGPSKESVLSAEDVMKLFTLLILAPAGIKKRRQGDMNSIETSLNMGILSVDSKNVDICHCLRSNVDFGRDLLKSKLKLLSNVVGANVSFEGEYPAWESAGVSKFASSTAALFEKMYGKKLKVYTEHAGLECALFYSRMEGLDAISIGPDIIGAHTVQEAVSISSVKREWDFFVELLKV